MGLPDAADLQNYVHCFGGRLNPALYAGRPKISFLLQVRGRERQALGKAGPAGPAARSALAGACCAPAASRELQLQLLPAGRPELPVAQRMLSPPPPCSTSSARGPSTTWCRTSRAATPPGPLSCWSTWTTSRTRVGRAACLAAAFIHAWLPGCLAAWLPGCLMRLCWRLVVPRAGGCSRASRACASPQPPWPHRPPTTHPPPRAAKWAELAYNTSGMVVPVVSNNVHEIRAYNRLAAAARGSILVVLQDDQLFGGGPVSEDSCKWVPAKECGWLLAALSLSSVGCCWRLPGCMAPAAMARLATPA